MRGECVLGVLLEKVYGPLELARDNTLHKELVREPQNARSVGFRTVHTLSGLTIPSFNKAPEVLDYKYKF